MFNANIAKLLIAASVVALALLTMVRTDESKQRIGALLEQGLVVRNSVEEQIEAEVLRQSNTNNWLVVALFLAMLYFFCRSRF